MDFVLIRIYVLHCWVRLRRNVVLNPSSFRLSAQKIAICNSFAIVYIVHSTWVYNVKESTLPHPNWAVSLMLLFLLLSLVTSAASSALFCHPRPSILLLNGRNAHHTIPTIRRSRLRQSRDYHIFGHRIDDGSKLSLRRRRPLRCLFEEEEEATKLQLIDQSQK